MAGINSVNGINAVAAVNGSQPDRATPAKSSDGAADVVVRGADRAAASESPAPAAGNLSAAERRAQEVEVQQSAGKVQQLLAKAAPNLTFSVDQDSGRTVIKIVDPVTKEVLRQIPAEEILRMDKNIDQMIQRYKGLLIDRQG